MSRAPTQAAATGVIAPEPSEAVLGLHQELHALDRRVAVEWEGEVDMDHVTEPRAGITDAQTEAGVGEESEARGGERRASPGAPGVEEHRTADPEQPEDVPVGEVALLDSE